MTTLSEEALAAIEARAAAATAGQKHTPQPWGLGGSADNDTIDIEGPKPEYRVVCRFGSETPRRRADAELILAALASAADIPSLCQALREAAQRERGLKEALRKTVCCAARARDGLQCDLGYGHPGRHQSHGDGPLTTFAEDEPVIIPTFEDLFPSLAGTP